MTGTELMQAARATWTNSERWLIALSVYLMALVFTTQPHAANVVGHQIDDDDYMLLILGPIEPGDLIKIKKVIRDRGYPFTTNISSPGGDVEEALEIGRFFNNAFMTVMAKDQCDSSCFLIWAGAYHRTVDVKLGLHRPYFNPRAFAELSANDARKKYAALNETVDQYLVNMSVPRSLIDKMMATESIDIWYLPPQNVHQYISEYSPALKEWFIAKCGSLSAKERTETLAISALWIAENRPEHVDSSIQRQARYAKSLTASYRKSLQKKASDIALCELEAKQKERASIPLD